MYLTPLYVVAVMCPVLTSAVLLPGEMEQVCVAIGLRACYSMSGTDVAYAATSCALDIIGRSIFNYDFNSVKKVAASPLPPTRCPVLACILLRIPYAIPGNDVGYAATRFPR
eukprot:657087-Rhodomonas_salina.5